jgi:hypothetical protein
MEFEPEISLETPPSDNQDIIDVPTRINPSPDIIAIFGIQHALGNPYSGKCPTISGAYKLNMPILDVQAGPTGSPIVPLALKARRKIRARSRQIVDIPYEHQANYELNELLRYQRWLDCMAVGMSEEEVAEQLDVGRRTVGRVSGQMREHLGATNQAAIMYGALLHGYTPDITPPLAARPTLTINRNLHLYLAALGFEAGEAADMTGQKASDVRFLRINAARRLGAKAMTQAITHAFLIGHFKPLSSLGQ